MNAPIEKRLWSSIARNFITGSQEEQLIVEIQSREAIGELTRLRNENASLRADSERLDWLTDALDWVELGDCVATDYDAEGRSRLDAWRLAIDAARKEKP